MRRTWAAGAAIVMCLALGGLPVGAQSPPVPEHAAWVTGTQDCSVVDAGTSTVVDGVVEIRNQVLECVKTMTDPRVSGTYTAHFNADDRGDAGVTWWGTHEMVGPDHAWLGSFNGLTDAQGQVGGFGAYEGSGAYSGWTFLDTPSGSGLTAKINGMLYQGPPPPLGPLPSPASE